MVWLYSIDYSESKRKLSTRERERLARAEGASALLSCALTVYRLRLADELSALLWSHPSKSKSEGVCLLLLEYFLIGWEMVGYLFSLRYLNLTPFTFPYHPTPQTLVGSLMLL